MIKENYFGLFLFVNLGLMMFLMWYCCESTGSSSDSDENTDSRGGAKLLLRSCRAVLLCGAGAGASGGEAS